MPAGMEAWDLGHASFVAAVRFHYRYVYHAHSDEGAWLAKNWTKKKDCVTRRLYYESDVTGRKQWNVPRWRPGKPEDEESEAGHHHKRHHRRKKHSSSHHKANKPLSHSTKHRHGKHDDGDVGDDDKGKHEDKHHGQRGGLPHLQSEARLVEAIKKEKERLRAAAGGLPDDHEEKPRKSKRPHKKRSKHHRHGHHSHNNKRSNKHKTKSKKHKTKSKKHDAGSTVAAKRPTLKAASRRVMLIQKMSRRKNQKTAPMDAMLAGRQKGASFSPEM